MAVERLGINRMKIAGITCFWEVRSDTGWNLKREARPGGTVATIDKDGEGWWAGFVDGSVVTEKKAIAAMVKPFVEEYLDQCWSRK